MKMIYFDNGASSQPKPPGVYEKTYRYVKHNGANSGRSSHPLAMEAAESVFEVRNSLCRMFHAESPENIVFMFNATYALNTVLQGSLKKGDHVITTNLEHNSVLRPLYALQKRGVELDIIDVDLYDDDLTVRRIQKKIRPNTKMIAVTQCSNVCGKILPIAQIAKLKNSRIRMLVDGSQGAGSMPTDFNALEMDYYCAPSHKGMLGLQGTGFIISCHNDLKPLVYGGTGGDSALTTQPEYLPERLEAGTLPIPAIYSLGEGVKFIEKIGVENIYRHKLHLTDVLYRKLLTMPQVELYLDNDKSPACGVLSFNIKGHSSEEVGAWLGERGIAVRSGLHCAPLFHKKMGTLERGMVRVSFSYANHDSEIAHFVELLKDF